MKIEYGPPGAVGVKHLQYFSGDEPSGSLGKAVLAFAAGALLGYLMCRGRRR